MASIRWLGHAAFEVEVDGKVVLIDPWLTNPFSPVKPEDIEKADIVLVTHDHMDHLGEAVEILKRTGATFVGIYELALYMQEQGVKDVVPANIGGPVEVKGLKIALTPATHSCTRGAPVGYVVVGKELSFYHAGDTGIFESMKLIGELYKPRVAMLPIGGTFTMDCREAAKAVELLKPEIAIPMHYNTFPPIKADPEEFKKLVEEAGTGTRVVVLKPGERLHL